MMLGSLGFLVVQIVVLSQLVNTVVCGLIIVVTYGICFSGLALFVWLVSHGNHAKSLRVCRYFSMSQANSMASHASSSTLLEVSHLHVTSELMVVKVLAS